MKWTITVRWRTCGKAACRCRTEGQRHGPYAYARVRQDNGTWKDVYLGKVSPEDTAEYRERLEAHLRAKLAREQGRD